MSVKVERITETQDNRTGTAEKKRKLETENSTNASACNSSQNNDYGFGDTVQTNPDSKKRSLIQSVNYPKICVLFLFSFFFCLILF